MNQIERKTILNIDLIIDDLKEGKMKIDMNDCLPTITPKRSINGK